MAQLAVEHVVGGIAPDHVVAAVAGAVDRHAAEQRQVLDAGIDGQTARDGRGESVDSRAVGHGVIRVAEYVSVVAGAAIQEVVAGAAVQEIVAAAAVEDIVAAVADDEIREPVAGAVDVAGSGQDQVLDIDAERVADARSNNVDTASGGLDDPVAGIVDDVDVVAAAADHDVTAGAAIERVLAGAALEAIIAGEPEQAVVAAEAAQNVVGAGSAQPVGPAVAVDGCHRFLRCVHDLMVMSSRRACLRARKLARVFTPAIPAC